MSPPANHCGSIQVPNATNVPNSIAIHGLAGLEAGLRPLLAPPGSHAQAPAAELPGYLCQLGVARVTLGGVENKRSPEGGSAGFSE